jgi:hypothetical protein
MCCHCPFPPFFVASGNSGNALSSLLLGLALLLPTCGRLIVSFRSSFAACVCFSSSLVGSCLHLPLGVIIVVPFYA